MRPRAFHYRNAERVSQTGALRLCGEAVAVLLLFTLALPANAQEAIPPAPTRWVTDSAGFLSASAAETLNQRLEAYEKTTGRQILVWIGTTTGRIPIEDWTVRAFEAWRVGRKGIDDGLVLFIFAGDRRLRIEVGYGLEGAIPDALAGRIISEVITPRIQSGNSEGAVEAGVNAIVQALGGQAGTGPPSRGERGARPLTWSQIVFYGIAGFFLLVLFITNPQLAMYLLISVLSSGRTSRHGGGWGGGGFSGGGGRSGGGGASGSW